MFEGFSADMCTEKIPLLLAEGLACADPGARTSIDASGNFISVFPISEPAFLPGSTNLSWLMLTISWHLVFLFTAPPLLGIFGRYCLEPSGSSCTIGMGTLGATKSTYSMSWSLYISFPYL
jgi:hypothetical protein